MQQSYPFHDLGDDEFEELIRHICREILGTGTIAFAKGKDGGRDAVFEGKAQKFPSKASPLEGKFIIQVKHTSSPVGSCSDRDFLRVLSEEKQKIEKLIKNNEIDHYLVFTNRKAPANQIAILRSDFKKIGLKEVCFFGTETIREYLVSNPQIWKNLGFARFEQRFELQTFDLVEIINGFHDTLGKPLERPKGLSTFSHIPKPKKNKINHLSQAYYDYMQRDSLPYFSEIEAFFKNPRNEDYRFLYEDSADEIKGKIIAHKSSFDNFDQALVHVADVVSDAHESLKRKKRFIRIFLHYMYFTCDIGQNVTSD